MRSVGYYTMQYTEFEKSYHNTIVTYFTIYNKINNYITQTLLIIFKN